MDSAHSPQPSAAHFVDPNWAAPLSVARELEGIPKDATLSGMFSQAVVDAAEKRGHRLPSASARYTAFRFYPLREHVRLLFEAAELFFPDMPMRHALRQLGRGTAATLLKSTLGKVVIGSAQGPHQAIEGLAKSYELNLKPGRAKLTSATVSSAVVALHEVCYLVDTNHVGAFEGLMRHLRLPDSRVRIAVYGADHAELLLTWSA